MTASGGQPRILLGHLVSNGDCLYATAVARQIKADFPGCHLTWAIGSPCRALLEGNPYVDDVWEIPFPQTPSPNTNEVWDQFRATAETRRDQGEFDHIFYTQILPDHSHFYSGMIRSTTFRGYPRPITVPVAPVLRLTTEEVDRVRRFAEENGLPGCDSVVLFECAPRSGQSSMTPDLALTLARQIVAQTPAARVILSSSAPLATGHPHICNASTLTLRENAELTRYCTLLIGCSSGITWISTSDAAKPLPMIQLLKRDAMWFNSVRRDFRRWGLPVETVIEIEDSHANFVPACVHAVFTEGFAPARATFHERVPPNFRAYVELQRGFLRQRNWRKAWTLLEVNIAENGLNPAFAGCHLLWFARSFKRRFYSSSISSSSAEA